MSIVDKHLLLFGIFLLIATQCSIVFKQEPLEGNFQPFSSFHVIHNKTERYPFKMSKCQLFRSGCICLFPWQRVGRRKGSGVGGWQGELGKRASWAGRRRLSLPPCGHLEPQRVMVWSAASYFGGWPENCIISGSFASTELLLSFFFLVHFHFLQPQERGKLLRASKILYSGKISAERKRSRSREGLLKNKMLESLARSLFHLAIASFCKNRDLWGKSQGQSWHLSSSSPGQLGKSGQMKSHLLSHVFPWIAVQISSPITF